MLLRYVTLRYVIVHNVKFIYVTLLLTSRLPALRAGYGSVVGSRYPTSNRF